MSGATERCGPAAVLFDWDGTLVDTRAALLAAWHEVTEAVLGRRYPVTEHDIATALSRRGSESFPLLAPDPAVATALADAFGPAYRRHGDTTAAFPGIAAVLDDLDARGSALGVVTSKTRDRFDADVDRAGLTGRFAVVVCAEDVAAGKPDPEGVHRALDALGVRGGDAVVVGDSPADIGAGAAAGAATVGVGWGFFPLGVLRDAGADTLVDTTDALARVLAGVPTPERTDRRG